MNWFEEAFGDFGELKWYTLLIMIAALAAGIAGIVWYARKHSHNPEHKAKARWTTHELTTASLCIGLSFLLSFIKLFSMPTGGSITPGSMLPVMAFAYMFGLRKGLVASLVYALLQFLQNPVVLAPMQVILDYPLAFGALALAGLAKKSIIPGIIYGSAGRFVCAFLSGWVFFGEYAPEGVPGWIYSLSYNGAIIGVECAVCIVIALIPGLNKLFVRQKELAQREQSATALRQNTV